MMRLFRGFFLTSFLAVFDQTIAGEFYRVFELKTLVPVTAGDNITAYQIASFSSIPRHICIGQCSSNIDCKTVLYHKTNQSCLLFNEYADSSLILDVADAPSSVVQSKQPKGTKRSDTPKSEIDRINGTVMGQQNVCVREHELGIARNTLPTTAYVGSQGCAVAAQQPWHARIGEPTNAWCGCNAASYLQVDLGSPRWVTKISIQGGSGQGNAWVTFYKIQISHDPTGVNWATFKSASGSDVIFTGNTDSAGIVNNTLWRPLLTRWIRIVPQAFSGAICMRLAVYGCHSQCRQPLGIHSHDVDDNQMTSDATWHMGYHLPYYGRLNNQRGFYHEGPTHRQNVYLEADFLKNRFVTGVAVQGAFLGWLYWLTLFSVQYQPFGDDSWYYYTDSKGLREFQGGVNTDGAVFLFFDYPVIARKIRILPKAMNGIYIAFRIEVFGCVDYHIRTYLDALEIRSNQLSATTTPIHDVVESIADGDRDTCAVASAFRISFDETKKISEVEFDFLVEGDLNPVGVWILDQFSRGYDLSGNGNHLYVGQSVSFVDDPWGRKLGAAWLPGTGDSMIYGGMYNEVFGVDSDHSVFFWMNTPTTGDRNLITFKDTSVSHADWAFTYWMLSGPRVVKLGLAATLYGARKASNPVPVNTWIHVGFTYEKATKRFIHWTNGEIDNEFALTVDFNRLARAEFYLGRHAANCMDSRNEALGVFCLQFYNRVLTRSEIMASKRCPWADYPKPFISLSLDDVTGSTDISGNSLTVADSNVSLTNFDQFPKKAFYFSNNSSTVTITSTALITRLAIYGPWAAFAHVTCITGPCTVFQLRNASNSVKWQLTMFQSGQNNAHTITAFCPGASIIGTANVSLRLGVTYYFGVTHDALTKNLRIFIDGRQMAIVSYGSCTSFSASSNDKLVIGGDNGVLKIACARFFDRFMNARYIHMLRTCPFTVADDLKAAAVYPAYGGWTCTANLTNVVNPTAATMASPNSGVSWGGGIPNYQKSSYGYSSYCFEGSTKYVDSAVEPGTAPTSAFTIMFWVWLNDFRNGVPIFQFGDASVQIIAINLHTGPNRILANALCADGNYASTGGAAPSTAYISDFTIAANNWFHIALVYNPAAGTQSLIIGGSMIHQAPATNCTLKAITKFYVAKVPWIGTYWSGCIQCLRIFKSALALEEINDMMTGCPQPSQVEPKSCRTSLTSTLDDTAFSASSTLNSTYYYLAHRAKLGNDANDGTLGCCWQPASSDLTSPWIQVTFPAVQRIASIYTKGSATLSSRVKTFTIKTASRGIGNAANWADYKDVISGSTKVFYAGSDYNAGGFNRLVPEIDTMYFRIYPTAYETAAVLQFALYGCPLPMCGADLLSGQPDTSFSSNNHQTGYEPYRGYIGSAGHWMTNLPGLPALPENTFVWWQVMLQTVVKITRVQSQGSGGNGYITSYYFRFSRDSVFWDGVRDADGFLKMLPGNTDQSSIVENVISPVFGRYVRIHPQTYVTNIAGRFGVRGCATYDNDPNIVAPTYVFYSNYSTFPNQDTCRGYTTGGTSGSSVTGIRVRCPESIFARNLSLATTYTNYAPAICEVRVFSETKPNLALKRKPLLVGPSASNTQIVNAVKLLTNGVAVTAVGQPALGDADDYIMVDLGMQTTVTRVVIVAEQTLRVGNSADVATASYCDTMDGTRFLTAGTGTLWCLVPAKGRYVFLTYNISYRDLYFTELLIY